MNHDFKSYNLFHLNSWPAPKPNVQENKTTDLVSFLVSWFFHVWSQRYEMCESSLLMIVSLLTP